MNQKKLPNTFMMISNWKKTFGLHGLHKNCQRFNPYSEEIDFSRQNFTPVDIRFWRLKVDLRTERVNIIYNGC